MNTRQIRIGILLPAALLAMLLLSNCKTQTLESNWRDIDIEIDGDCSEWNKGFHATKDQPIALSACNDNSDLYICMVTSDRRLYSQMMRTGFYVWIDPTAGKHKKLGIKFPIGIKDLTPSAFTPSRRRTGDKRFSTGPEMNMFEEVQTHFELHGPGKNDITIVPLINDKGIEIQTGHSKNKFVYELKIPLNKNGKEHEYVNASPGQKISLGLEIEQIQFGEIQRNPQMRGGMPGETGGRPGDIPGGINRRPGGTRGDFRGMDKNMPEPLKYWIGLNLASESDKNRE